MKPYIVNTLENWIKWEQWFHDNGYKPWQYQYRWDCPEGYHAWFAKAGCEDVEIVTFNKEVQEEILKYKKAPD